MTYCIYIWTIVKFYRYIRGRASAEENCTVLTYCLRTLTGFELVLSDRQGVN